MLVLSALDWEIMFAAWGMCLAIIVVRAMSRQSIQRRVSGTLL